MSQDAILAGDIGGTKTNLAWYSIGQGFRKPLSQATYNSQDYFCFDDILNDFMSQTGLCADFACLGVAGPVVSNRAKITKLPWYVDGNELAKAFNFKNISIINDLVATAHGLEVLPEKDILTVNHGKALQKTPKAIIAPGTGMGETYLTWHYDRYHAHPSEGGHALFSPANAEQLALCEYLVKNEHTLSVDTLCSGSAIPLIYSFIKSNYSESDWMQIDTLIAESGDPSPVISSKALYPDPSPVCVATIQLYVEILAGEASNLALKVLSTGGLYIGGGIPPKIVDIIKSHFMPAFIGNGSMKQLLATIPVKIILNPETALMGAGNYAANLNTSMRNCS